MTMAEDYAICEAAEAAAEAIDKKWWKSRPRSYSELPDAIHTHIIRFSPRHVKELLDRINELERMLEVTE